MFLRAYQLPQVGLGKRCCVFSYHSVGCTQSSQPKNTLQRDRSAHRLTHSPSPLPPSNPALGAQPPSGPRVAAAAWAPTQPGRERGTRWGLQSGRPPQPAPGRVSSIDNGSGSSASRTRREKNKAGGGDGAEPGDPRPPHCVSPRPPPGGLPLPPSSPP